MLPTDDFRSIPSAQLTLEQFHTHDAEVEYDPPAFIRNVVRDNATAQAKAEAAAAADPTMVDRHQRSHKVRLALPSADPKKGNEAGGTVSALVAAAAMALPGAQNSDSDEGMYLNVYAMCCAVYEYMQCIYVSAAF